MIFRLSQKLNTKIKVGKLGELPLDENPYADWSSHLFTATRTQYIIMSNTKSMYSVVMLGAGITNYSKFIGRAMSNIREFMEADGQAFVYQRFIIPASRTVRFANALNRSVTGSINELIKFAEYMLADDDMSPFDVGFRLNDILLSALGSGKSCPYGKPNEAFKLLSDNQ